ncbi:MAG TPA: hypothetical protein VK680_02545, partial [Solirubrobacteraceae bacterium]|nr:hypothetical protein [Solirubrobacteraceae bacterium]
SAVEFGMSRCDHSATSVATPLQDAYRAAAASRRLDDAFRNYLSERGAKPLSLARVTNFITGVSGLRLAGDAVLDLWQRDDGTQTGERAGARDELLHTTETVKRWYEDLANSLLDEAPTPVPLPRETAADERLVNAVRNDLHGDDGQLNGTAVRMIWTGDHLDAVRRLQEVIVGSA